MNNKHTSSGSKLELLSRLAGLCSEFRISLIVDEILSLITEQLPGYSVGLFLKRADNHSPLIAMAGEPEYLALLKGLLENYSRPTGLFHSENHRLEIRNGDFTIVADKNPRLLCKGLEYRGRNYGIIAVISGENQKPPDNKNEFLSICSNLIAGATATEFQHEAVPGPALPRISRSPRQTADRLLNIISTTSPAVAVVLGYLIPGDENAEVFFASTASSTVSSDFNADLSIPVEQFKPEIIHKQWMSALHENQLPEPLVSELEKHDTGEVYFHPLKGKKDYYGFCLVGFNKKIDGETEQLVSNAIEENRSEFSASAALLLLISSYKKLAVSDRNELVKLTAATVNHQINNQLAIILTAAQLILLKKEGLPEDIQRKIEMIEVNALRIKDVISSLRNLKNINIAEYLAGEKYLDID